ncbi:MAG: MoxR family ATPase [Acidobacteriota bacterium]
MEWRLDKDSVTLEVSSSDPTDGASSTEKITHLFSGRERHAVNAALAAGRPLLVRGEPGVGKTQLARATAKALGRRFISKVIDARTESQDLLYTVDAVRRLADAQLVGTSGLDEGEALEERLSELNYVEPGPLWWGFSWTEAHKQATRSKTCGAETPEDAPNGVVVLIDEIDKADSSVPNGLLESLGQREFAGPLGSTVRCDGAPPLIFVTTNEERSLPDAFLRRCLVLHLALPEDDSDLTAWLMRRGQAHFAERIDDAILEAAAKMLIEDRRAAQRRQLSPPGGAEYLDLLRALATLGETREEQESFLEDLREFTLQKHPRDGFG